MKDLIHSDVIAKTYFGSEESVDFEKIDKLISVFNDKLVIGESVVNTGLDNVEELNDREYVIMKAKANLMGWKLDVFADNYNTTSYRLKKTQ
jgi:hypothetical protein